jgi:hypothetical protein
LPPEKEAYHHSNAEPDGAKHGHDLLTERWWDGSSCVIDFPVGWSFDEPHGVHSLFAA